MIPLPMLLGHQRPHPLPPHIKQRRRDIEDDDVDPRQSPLARTEKRNVMLNAIVSMLQLRPMTITEIVAATRSGKSTIKHDMIALRGAGRVKESGVLRAKAMVWEAA